jgi:hypothetical protein
MTSAEYELKIEGVPRHFELRMVLSGEGEVVTIVRDFTEQRKNEKEQRRLGEEHAALRRVAKLVAADIPPEQVFHNVTEELCRLLGIPSAVLERFEGDGTATVGRPVRRACQRLRGRHGDRAAGGSRVDRRPANRSACAYRELRRRRRRDRPARARDGRRDEVEQLLRAAAQELSEAPTELRELAQGIHPAVHCVGGAGERGQARRRRLGTRARAP